jgi:hypothetical protein
LGVESHHPRSVTVIPAPGATVNSHPIVWFVPLNEPKLLPPEKESSAGPAVAIVLHIARVAATTIGRYLKRQPVSLRFIIAIPLYVER